MCTGGALGLAPVAQACGNVCAVWPDWLLEQLQAVQGCLLLQCQMSAVRLIQTKLSCLVCSKHAYGDLLSWMLTNLLS